MRLKEKLALNMEMYEYAKKKNERLKRKVDSRLNFANFVVLEPLIEGNRSATSKILNVLSFGLWDLLKHGQGPKERK